MFFDDSTDFPKTEFTKSFRFNVENGLDRRAAIALKRLSEASCKSEAYIVKELLVRYGPVAFESAVFNLSKTGLNESAPEPNSSETYNRYTQDDAYPDIPSFDSLKT